MFNEFLVTPSNRLTLPFSTITSVVNDVVVVVVFHDRRKPWKHSWESTRLIYDLFLLKKKKTLLKIKNKTQTKINET